MEEDQRRGAEASSPLPEFKTSIAPLDRLLGYNDDSGSGTGIRPGDVIVLRGGPGSGKTTLGLQIMSSYLASEDRRYAGDRLAAVFLSLEVAPREIIDKVGLDFGFFKERRGHLVAFPASAMKDMLNDACLELGDLQIGSLAQGALKLFANGIIGPGKDLIVPLYTLLSTSFQSSLMEVIPEQRSSAPADTDTAFEGILFIDSVNALLAILQAHARVDQWKSRVAIRSALQWIRRKCSRFVILVSSEFHHGGSWVPTGMSESFLSDVEILLSNEPIAVPSGYEASRQGSVGYNIYKIIEKVEGEGTKLESRSFLRVLKSRKGANQSRRCAYDIVSSTGLTFYETYPADGHILLFTENPKQEQVWNTFFQKDLPELYPALRYEHFDRSSLQRIFMNQRRSRYVPNKTDMYVSSFDNYWINWYGELCWRRAVAESIEASIPAGRDKAQVAGLISAVHRSLMEQPQELGDCTSRVLQRKGGLLSGVRLSKENRELILDDVLTAFASLSRKSNCMKCFLCRFSWWVLRQIAARGQPSVESTRACPPGEAQRIGSDKNGHFHPNIPPELLNDPNDAKGMDEITEVIHRIQKSIGESECCKSSPIRRFCAQLGNMPPTTETISNSLKSVGELDKSAYGRPANLEEALGEKAGKIANMFAQSTWQVSELLEAVDSLSTEMRSNDARRKLVEEILSCATSMKKCGPQCSDIQEILRNHFDERGGCECRVEFWKYLGEAVSKRIDAAQERIPEKKEFMQIRRLLQAKSDDVVNALFDTLPSMLGIRDETRKKPKSAQGIRDEKPTSVASLWRDCTGDRDFQAMYNLAMTYHLILKKRNAYHFLSDIPDGKVRLFGERRTTIIKELEEPSRDDKRPIHRPGLLFSLRDTRSLVSVPYNANISFIVYRHDLLKKFIKDHFGKSENNELNGYIKEVLKLYRDELDIIEKLYREPHHSEDEEKEADDFVRANIEHYVDSLDRNERSAQGPLQTWEELIVLLRWMDKEACSMSKNGKPRFTRHFVIETQTLDTLLCTVWEILWNCGGTLKIRPDYSVENEDDAKRRLFQALYLLTTMLNEGIIPDDSTLDVVHFAEEYSTNAAGNVRRGHDWVFARQWYSTLVELLTVEGKRPPEERSTAEEVRTSKFVWQNAGAELGIMPIPVSLSYYCEQKGKIGKNEKKDKRIEHISCWGDWHLIMTKGTENTELGIDLINCLMGSQKVCERAFQCAAVPTVEEFYELYGESSCLNLPERRSETPRMLPDITFNDLRDIFFKNAHSRSRIFDYEHCMLELQSLFRFIRILARCDKFNWNEPRNEGRLLRSRTGEEKQNKSLTRSEELKEEIEAAVKRIKALGTRGMLRV